MKNVKKLISALFAAVLAVTSTVSAFSVNAVTTSYPDTVNTADKASIEGTDSFGGLFASELTEKQEEQLANNGFNIFSVEMSGTEATVSYQAAKACTMVIGVYDESGTTLYATGTADVSPDERETKVTIETDVMPEYYYIKGYLADTYELNPLCTVYECPDYTQEMQEFLSKTVDDFDADRVINFDDDKTNNFAVYGEDTIVIQNHDGYNIVTEDDEANGIYVIENADDVVLGLKEGDTFSYEYEEGNIIVAKISEISIDGTTVTITSGDVEMEDIFDYVRIEEEGGMDSAEAYANPEIKNDSADTASILQSPKSDSESDFSAEQELVFNFKGEYKKGVKKLEDTGKTDKNGDKIQREAADFTGDATIEGSVSFKASFSAKINYCTSEVLNLPKGINNVELKISYEGNLNFSVSANVSFNINFESLEFKLLSGVVTLEISPQLVFKVEADIDLNGKWWGSLGARAVYEDGNIDAENISEGPEHSVECKMEGSLYIGVNLKPQIYLIDDNLISVNMEGEIGLKLKQTSDSVYDSSVDYTKVDSIHDCSLCYDGDVYLSGKVLFNITLIGIDSPDLYLVGSKDGNAEKKIADYYWSVDYDEFAMTECPHDLYRVRIITVDDNNDPVPDTPILLSSEGSIKSSSNPPTLVTGVLTTDENGELDVFCSRERVDYSIQVEDIGNSTTSTKSFTVEKSGDTIKARPSNNNIVTVEIPSKKYSVNVKAVDENGDPVSGAKLSAGNEFSLTTDDDGLATIRLTEGTHSLELLKRGYLLWKQDIEVTEDKEITATLKKNEGIRFVVKDTNGDPIPDVTASTNGDPLPGKTDSNGSVVFYPNVKGAYDITFSKKGYSPVTENYVYDGNSAETEIVMKKRTDSPKNEITWEFDESTGTLTISGTGKMENYDVEGGNNPPWYDYKDSTLHIVIEDGITYLGHSSFYNFDVLESVSIPGSVGIIGEKAFYDCSSLTSLFIPEGCYGIGSYVFYNCSSLSDVRLPDSLDAIDKYAFSKCDNLSSITIPNNVKLIGHNAFENSGLTSVNIPSNLHMIGAAAFRDCSKLATVTIPAAQNDMPVNTFNGFGNTDDEVVDLYVENNEVFVKNNAFGEGVFEGTPWLTSQFEMNPYVTVGTLIIDSDPASCSGSLVIPDGITGIEPSAFEDCDKLDSVTIPESVDAIWYDAFRDCGNLKTVTIENPDCAILDEDDTISNESMSIFGIDLGSDFYGTIYGYEGSTAQEYAEKYGYSFESLGPAPANISTAENEISTPSPDYHIDTEKISITSEEPDQHIVKLSDLQPDTVYNYYALYTDDPDCPLIPSNIQFITQFTTSSDGSAEINTGGTYISEDAVILTVPAVIKQDEDVEPPDSQTTTTPAITTTTTVTTTTTADPVVTTDDEIDGTSTAPAETEPPETTAEDIQTEETTTTEPYVETQPDVDLGDIDRNGYIDSSDASMALQEYALISTGQAGNLSVRQKKAADVNKDDVVDSSDASTILRYYAYTATGGKEPFKVFLTLNM